MADIVSGLYQAAIPRMGLMLPVEDGLRDFFKRGVFAAEPAPVEAVLKITRVKLAELIPYLTFDYERFALSSWDSFDFALLEQQEAQAASWPMLKLYYSAFFAAHGIMRLCGEGVVKLERPQIEVLQAVADTKVDPPILLMPGMFSVRFWQEEDSTLSALISKLADGSAHDGFWREFDGFLDRLTSRAVSEGRTDAALLVAGASELQRFWRPYGPRRSAWISSMRNEINYQHKHNAWRPARFDRRAATLLSGVSRMPSAAIRIDYALGAQDLDAFIAATSFLANLNADVANLIAANSTASRMFGQNWRRVQRVR